MKYKQVGQGGVRAFTISITICCNVPVKAPANNCEATRGGITDLTYHSRTSNCYELNMFVINSTENSINGNRCLLLEMNSQCGVSRVREGG